MAKNIFSALFVRVSYDDMAGEKGIEPLSTVLETVVLPLNYSPIWYIIHRMGAFVNGLAKIMQKNLGGAKYLTCRGEMGYTGSDKESIMAKTILTGIKPTGTPHWGNYFGAIKPAIDMSANEEYQCMYFVADYHSLTTIDNARDLTEYTYEIACTWLACGLDAEKVLFYKQSSIPETFELAVILSNLTPKGLMNRAHAYKAIVERNEALGVDVDSNVNMGLYNYPILMTADILLMNSRYVPVGADQKQHVEIARDICDYFNKRYGKALVRPECVISEAVATMPGLDGRKMSKSYGNQIPIFCDRATLEKKIKSIKTDSSLPGEPKSTDCVLYQYMRLFASDAEMADITERFRAGISWAEAKAMLFDLADRYFAPMREKYEYYMSHRDEVDEILRRGSERARVVARETLDRVRGAIGVKG